MDDMYNDPEKISVFLDELEEQLKMLEQYILELMQGDENSEIIPKTFRDAHTLKDASVCEEE